jgi:hypothetical protein
MYYERGGMCLDNVTLPAWPGTRNRLGLRHHGLIPVHLARCLFLLPLPFLCVAYSCAVVDKKDHTTGAIHLVYIISSDLLLLLPTIDQIQIYI